MQNQSAAAATGSFFALAFYFTQQYVFGTIIQLDTHSSSALAIAYL